MHGGDIYNNRVKYDFSVNLNPYPASWADRKHKNDEHIHRIANSLAGSLLYGLDSGQKYPDIDQTELRNDLAGSEGVKIENVFAGCGASELLMAVSRVLMPKTALLIEPCFTGYKHVLSSVGCSNIVRYFLKEEDGFVFTDDVIGCISDDIDVVFLADPNNPTARNIDPDLLIQIIDAAKSHKTAVVLDESFFDISEGRMRRSADLMKRYEDIYIIRSYTKSFALPGVRMGYVITSGENITRIRAQLPEWNLPSLSESVMSACAKISEDDRYYSDSMELVRKERDFLIRGLTDLGMTVFDSDTVFLLIKGPEGLYEKLLRSHILIRKCDDMAGLDGCFYRIAVRDHKANTHLINTLKRQLKK